MDREDRLLAYLQDRLPANDAEQFEAEIAADDSLAAEVAALRAVRAELAGQDAAEDPAAGWARLSEALDQEASEPETPKPETPEPANLNRPIRLSLLQAAGLVLASLLLWQFAVLPTFDDPGAGFDPVSEEQAGPVLQVIFEDDARLAEISAFLRANGGTILDGPSAVGLYRIGFADQTARDAASEALTERPDLVVSVTTE